MARRIQLIRKHSMDRDIDVNRDDGVLDMKIPLHLNGVRGTTKVTVE